MSDIATAEQRAAWKEARKELDAIEVERDAAIKIAVAPFKERFDAARQRMEEVEDPMPTHLYDCEFCREPIFEGDAYHHGDDGSLCETCAPSYGDMLESPEHFCDFDDNGDDIPMTKEAARQIVDAHLAAGGSLEDKAVTR